MVNILGIILIFCFYSLLNCVIAVIMLSITNIYRFREIIKDRDFLFFAIGLPLLLYNKFEDRIKERKRKRKVRKLKKKLRKLNDDIRIFRSLSDSTEKRIFHRDIQRRNDTIRELDELMTEDEREELENKVSIPGKVKRMI